MKQRHIVASRACMSFLTTLGLAGVSSSAQAAVITGLTVGDAFLQYFNVGPNPLSFSAGQFIRYGATTVIPNGIDGTTPGSPVTTILTTGTASTTNLSTNAPINRTIFPLASPATPDFFSGALAVCTVGCTATANNNPSNLTGPWNLTFSNTGTTPNSVTKTLSLAGSGEIPFVSSVTLSGTPQLPTFSWAPPAGLPVNGYRINIYQHNLETFNGSQVVNTGQVTSRNLAPTTTSYTVSSADFTHGVALATNTTYTIEISVLETRDGSTTNLSNGNVSAISRVYSTFQTLPAGTGPVVLPTVTGNATFTFDLPVVPGVVYSIDPTVATGYIYRTGVGDPNFASVSLPDLGNPNPYALYLWNGTNFVFDISLAANTTFNFASGGVNEFEVLGIDPALGLDPNNTTAFITALTFEGPGTFTGTMTAVTTDVDVPEPASLGLLASGLMGLGLIHRRRKPLLGAASANMTQA